MSFDKTGCNPLHYRLVGDPVDVVTGANTFQIVDFSLVGPIPFEWRRYYNSLQTNDSYPLGWGHNHEYNRHLQFDIDGLRFTDPSGQIVTFPFLLEDGDESSGDGLILRRLDSKNYQIYEYRKPVMEFEFGATYEPAVLRRLTLGKFSINFRYDADNRLEAITDSKRRSIRVQYSEHSKIVSLHLHSPERDEYERLITYHYDDKGNLIEGVDFYGNPFGFTYDDNNRMISRTDRRGYTFHFKYDKSGKCVQSTGEDGLHETHLRYLPVERTTIVTRADGGEWVYLYNENGTITQIVDPYGGIKLFNIDDQGRIIEEIDQNGNAIKWLYSEAGSPIGKMSPFGQIIPIPENPNAPRPFEHRVPNCPVEWEYGNLIDLQRNPRIEWSSDIREPRNMTRTPDLRGLDFPKNCQVYDDNDLLIREITPSGGIRRWTYDANGNIEQYIDGDDSKYTYEYTSWNLLKCKINPLGHRTSFEYTSNESIAAIVDPGGTRSEYLYDLKNRLIEVSHHGTVMEQYHYDSEDNLIEKLDANGNILLSLEIGSNNLITSKTLASGEKQSFRYDEYGRCIHAFTDEIEVIFAYDDEGNIVVDERNGRGLRHTFFDVRSEIITTLFDRFKIHYRSVDNRTMIIEDPGGASHKIIIGKDHISRNMSNAFSEFIQFNSSGSVVRKTLSSYKNNVRQRDIKYEYSAENDLLRIHDSLHGEVSYEYDKAHRLYGSYHSDGSEQIFNYDTAGNLIHQPGLDGVVIGHGNRLVAANGYQFEYNNRGAIKLREKTGSTTRYFYDSRRMLTHIETDGNSWNAQYDLLDRRTCKIFGSRRIDYYWDSDKLAAEIRDDGTMRIYIYADTFSIVPLMFMEYESIEADAASGKRFFIFTNHIGAPIEVQDESGKVVWRGRIDPYGYVHIDPVSDIELPIRFPGHYFDPETGLHYNRFRYYSPELGRYLQPDPAGIGNSEPEYVNSPDKETVGFEKEINLYSYSENPLREVDVRGLGCPENRRRIQPEDLGPDGLGYRTWPRQMWRWWGRENAPPKGYKIHVSVSADDGYIVARSVTARLREMGIPHKIAPNTERYRTLNQGDQRGKFITIYPGDAANAQRVLNAIDPELTSLRNEGGIQPGPRPTTRQSGHTETEIPVGNSGMTSTYYYDETSD